MKQESYTEQLEFINRIYSFYFILFQMAQTFISNYKIIYGINENDEHLKWIKTQKFGDYKIFKRICELATETLVVPSERWFDLEINPVEHDQLLRDITKCFITRF